MVLPYQVLHGDVQWRMEELRLTCGKWESGWNPCPSERVVTISLESFCSEACTDWLKGVANSGKLGTVVFDEAHGLVEDSAFRSSYNATIMQLMKMPNCTIMFCSATMSPHHMEQFWNAVKVEFSPGTSIQIIHSRTQRPNICYQVLNSQLGRSPGKESPAFGDW
jgi:superfamily II DNA helicase RecQ